MQEKQIQGSDMIIEELVEQYLESMCDYNSTYCEEIREKALATEVPIIKRNTESILKLFLQIKRPRKILEVGTAIGYSALLMAEISEAEITTIEKYLPRIEIAKKNIESSDFKRRITLLEGDATQILKNLVERQEKYDFIFMDAAKAQYIRWLPLILELMEKDAILFSDNVLQEGEVAGSRYAICRRNRSIYSHMREYLYQITHNKELVTSILSVSDGIAISMKKIINGEAFERN